MSRPHLVDIEDLTRLRWAEAFALDCDAGHRLIALLRVNLEFTSDGVDAGLVTVADAIHVACDLLVQMGGEPRLDLLDARLAIASYMDRHPGARIDALADFLDACGDAGVAPRVGATVRP